MSEITKSEWTKLQTDILDIKRTIKRINADLEREIEQREHSENDTDEKEFICDNWEKMIENVTKLSLECGQFKFNLQKLFDSHRRDKRISIPKKEGMPVQEEGQSEKVEDLEAVIKRGKPTAAHPTSKTDSGIEFDWSRPGSTMSERSLSTVSEPCENEDHDTNRISKTTKALLKESGEKASSRRPDVQKRGSSM